ncbi:Zinc finger MYM-type protein 1-like [Oopsacas minuta]|uniref:Zinc finger MYM-type protein 1-like n=1 Tax=Oopsacas minuta TaxID=111878 RepID=A0AAV7JII7_9METZ|nr:Zinc finger MYM-type protein 1-like [Oopsacas minuta]
MDPKRKCLLDYFCSNATSSQSSNPEFNLNIDGNDTTMQGTLLVDPESLPNQDSSYIAEGMTERSSLDTDLDLYDIGYLYLCGQEILIAIVSEIQKIGYFAILADETTDSSHQKHLCFCIRYVSEDAFIKEEFISYGAMEFVDAKSITDEILSRVTSTGLNIDNCIAQCYDGCSTMSGHISGVTTRIIKHAPLAIYLHCTNHRLNLVLNDSSKLTEIRHIFDIVSATINYINDSSGRRNVFDAQFISYCSTRAKKISLIERIEFKIKKEKVDAKSYNYFQIEDIEETDTQNNVEHVDTNSKPLSKSLSLRNTQTIPTIAMAADGYGGTNRATATIATATLIDFRLIPPEDQSLVLTRIRWQEHAKSIEIKYNTNKW